MTAIVAAGAGATVVFCVLHQVLVEPSLVVLVAFPAAVVLAAPLVLAYRSLIDEDGDAELSGPGVGLAVAAGLAVHLVLVAWAVRDRTAAEATLTGLHLASLVAAPAVSGVIMWVRTRHVVAATRVVLGTGMIATVCALVWSSASGAARVGALACAAAAAVAAGWIAERTSAESSAVAPKPHAGWMQDASQLDR